jgi:hypothetical protein
MHGRPPIDDRVATYRAIDTAICHAPTGAAGLDPYPAERRRRSVYARVSFL